MSTIITVLALWGLLVFFNWVLIKVGADFDDWTYKAYLKIKEQDKSNINENIKKDVAKKE